MRTIKPTAEIIAPDITNKNIVDGIYKSIELAGRTCYKSKNRKVAEIEEKLEFYRSIEALTTEQVLEVLALSEQLEEAKRESARTFVRGIVKSGHEAMIEHVSMTVKFTVDRGVSHELVRHRLASFAQSSTRYCNYSQDKFGNEITVIKPYLFDKYPIDSDSEPIWMNTFVSNWLTAMESCEAAYIEMTKAGVPAEWARTVLPNSLMTEVVMTANMREWRHFFKLRAAGTTGKPHPQMVEVALPLLLQCKEAMPELFGDIEVVNIG